MICLFVDSNSCAHFTPVPASFFLVIEYALSVYSPKRGRKGMSCIYDLLGALDGTCLLVLLSETMTGFY